MVQNREPKNKAMFIWRVNSMRKQAKISNGEKTASLINDVEKTGQVHAKESNFTTFSHHIQKLTKK